MKADIPGAGNHIRAQRAWVGNSLSTFGADSALYPRNSAVFALCHFYCAIEKMSPQPTDPDLYEKIKKDVYNRYKKHSAYRSGQLVKQYKEKFQEKHGSRKSPYKGQKPAKKGLTRWFAEDWRNESGGTGYDQKNTLYRPKNRISEDTPTTWGELSKSEIQAAKREKKMNGRVSKFKK